MISRIGRYEVQAELGRGGFGQVFRAWDPTVGRLVAIKTLTASGEPEMITRFRNEAAAAGKLRHHNIVIIYDFGEHEGTPFLVMELLDGEDLERIVANRREIPLLKKLDVMTQAAAGLHHAHSKGVVHRDVKPANIMLLADGNTKIMDFGIALLTQATAARITPQGSMIGTLPFMAPEQFYGSASDVLTDIFAFGVTCYKLLTGTHPFHAPEMGGLMYNIMNKAPVPVRNLNPDCPEALEQVIFKLLAKDRDSRYQTLEDAHFDLEPIIQDLRRENVSELLAKARDLVAADDLESAQPVVREAIELDPGNRTARDLREMLARQIKDRAVRPRVAALVNEGREQLGERKFDQAIEKFESALRLDKSNPEIHALVEQARAAWERAQRAERLLHDAREALHREDLTAAHKNVAAALSTDPQHADAETLMAAVREQMEARERERRLRESLGQVKRLMLLQSFEGAIELAGRILEEHPENREAGQLLESAHREQQAHLRRQRLQTATEEVKEFLRHQRFAEAADLLSRLQPEFPESAELRDLASYAADELKAQKQAEVIARTTAETRKLVAAAEFDAAIERLQSALAEYPGVSALRDLLQNVASEKAEYQRKTALNEVLRQGATLVSAERFAEAIERVGAFVRGYGDAAELESVRKQAEEGLAKQRRLAAARKMVLEAQSFLDDGKPADASRLLQQATVQFPDHSELAQLLGIAQENLRAQQKAEAISKMIAEAESLARGKRFDRAIDLIDGGRKQYPGEDRLVRCLEAIQAGKTAHERDVAMRETMSRVRHLQSQGKRAEAVGALESAVAAGLHDATLLDLKRQIENELAEQRRADEVHRTVAQAHELLQTGRLDSASQLLQDATRLYPSEGQLQALTQELEKRRRQLERAEEIVKAIQETRAHIDTANFDRALQLLDKAEKRYGPDDALERAREAALAKKKAHDREAALVNAVSGAAGLLKAGRLDEALAAIDRTTQQLGEDPRLAALRTAVEADRETRRREEEAQKIIRRARDLLGRNQPAQAADLLRPAVAAAPSHQQLAGLLAEAEEKVRDLQREQAIAAAVDEVNRLHAAGQIEQALWRLGNAMREFPNARSLEQLRDPLALAHARAEALALARRQHKEHNYEAALQAVDKGLQIAAGDRDLLEIKARIESDIAKQREAEAVNRMVEQAQAFIAGQRFEDAATLLKLAATQYPRQAPIADLLRTVEEELHRQHLQRVAEAVKRCVEKAQLSISHQHFEDAAALLKQADAEYPKQPAITDLLRTVDEELRRQRLARETEAAKQIVAKAETLLLERRLDDAAALLKKAAAQYPNQSPITDLLRTVAEEQRKEELRREAEAVRQIVEQAQALLREQRFADATALLKRAAQDRPKEPQFTQLLQTVTDEQRKYQLQQEAEAVRKIVEQAQTQLAGQRFADATALLKRAAQERPKEPQFTQLLQTVAEEQRKYQLQQEAEAVRQIVEQAQTLLIEQRFADATALLKRAAQERPKEPQLTQLLQTVADEQRKYHLQQEAEVTRQIVEQARALIAAQRFTEATTLVKKAASERPKEPQFKDLLRSIDDEQKKEGQRREAEAIKQIVGQAQVFIDEQRFEDAALLLKQAVAGRPKEPQFTDLLRAVEEELRNQHLQREAEAVRQTLEKAQAMVREKRLGDASAFLKQALTERPREAQLTELLRTVDEELRNEQLQREAEAVRQVAEKAQAMIREKRFTDTASFLKQAAVEYPKQAPITDLLRTVEEEQQKQQRLLEINEARAQMESLLAQGKEDQAIALIESRYANEPAFQELLQRARQEVDRKRHRELIRQAEDHAKNARLPEAVRLVEQAIERHGSTEASAKLLASLRNQLEQQARREARDRDFAQLHELEAQLATGPRKKKLLKLDSDAKAIAARYAGDKEFTVAAERIRKQIETALATAEAAPAFNRMWLAGGAAVAAVITAIALLIPHGGDKPKDKDKEPVTTVPIEVRSDPQGASVRVGDQSCTTPSCRFDLKPGQYSVEARLNGYQPLQKTVDLDAQHPVVDLVLQPEAKAELPPKTATGTLVVHAGIPGALVFVDNTPKGRTNAQGDFEAQLEAASHDVRVEKAEYLTPPQQRVKIAEGRPATVSFTLTSQTATLELRGAPAGVTVRVNNSVLSITGRNLFSVPAGNQRIQITNGAQTFAVTQNFEAGKPVTLDWNNIAPKVDLEAQEWDRVKDSSDPAQVQSFLDKYGSGPHQVQARALADRLTWTKLDKNDINALRAYLRNLPGGSHAQEAKSLIEALSWAAVNQQSADSLRNYLRDFPDGAHAREARTKSADLQWTSVDKNDERALTSFIAQFPDGSHKNDAQTLLDQIRKKKADADALAATQREQQNQAQEQAKEQARLQAKLLAEQSQGIQTALDSFNNAFSSHNPKQLKDIWPKVSNDYTQNMYRDKNNFVVLSLVTVDKPAITGETAVVRCDVLLNSSINGKPRTARNTRDVLLHRQNNRWIISEIR